MEKIKLLDCPIDFDENSFFDLMSLSVGRMIAIQNNFGALAGDKGWNVNIKDRFIKFGDNEYKSGILGVEDHKQNTWLWSWANVENGLPELAAAPARRAKKALPKVPEFTIPKFELDPVHTGHNLAMVCCAVSEKNVIYYRCPYDGGAMFMQVEGMPEEIFRRTTKDEFMQNFADIIKGYFCDHRLLVAGALWMNGYPFELDGPAVIADFSEEGKEDKVCFVFDNSSDDGIYRISDITVK